MRSQTSRRIATSSCGRGAGTSRSRRPLATASSDRRRGSRTSRRRNRSRSRSAGRSGARRASAPGRPPCRRASSRSRRRGTRGRPRARAGSRRRRSTSSATQPTMPCSLRSTKNDGNCSSRAGSSARLDRFEQRADRRHVAALRGPHRVADRVEQLVVEAVEAARRQHAHDVAGRGALGELLDDRVDIGRCSSPWCRCGADRARAARDRSDPRPGSCRIEQLADDHLVGVRERVGELVLERLAPARRRARLVDRDQAALREPLAQRLQRLAHRRRMMRVVVEHGDAAGDAAQLLATPHAREARDAALDVA